MALEMKGYEKFTSRTSRSTRVLLCVFVRLRLDLVQTGNQLFVICLDALESLRFICRPRGNKTVYTIDGVRSGRVECEIGKCRYRARPTVDLWDNASVSIPKGYNDDSHLR